MRKVELDVKAQNKYEVIKKLVETNGNTLRASTKLGCSMKTIDRMIKGYKEEGKVYFVHGNKGRQPVHTIPKKKKEAIVDLYQNKYFEANFTHFMELLSEHENIDISETTIRTILMNNNILSPKATKKVKRRVKAELLKKKEDPGVTLNEIRKIEKTIIDIEDAHPRRPRCAYFGEMIQMDASKHYWVNGEKWHLHAAIDDSTGTLVGAYFDKEETLNGYYNVLHQILVNYGIPAMFFTDRRTIFEYKKKDSQDTEDDTFTQFSYACKQLGVEIRTSSVPQAKGRVERLFQTMQSRLPLEMKLAGVTDIKSANEFLNHYVKKFNAKFSLPINFNKSVFEVQPPMADINIILSVVAERTVDDGHCIRFNKKYFNTIDENQNHVYHRKKTPALVMKAFDGHLYASINDTVFGLEEVQVRKNTSKNYDFIEDEPKQKSNSNKAHTPSINHPWKASSYRAFLRKQEYLKQKSA